MRRRYLPLMLLACAPAFGGTALAQAPVVSGVLREAGTSRLVAGAAVYLLDRETAVAASGLSDDRGAFRLRAPGPGTYRIRVERIGFESELSAPFEVGEEGRSDMSMVLQVRAIELDPLVVQGERVCDIQEDVGGDIAKVWGEARKALSATVLSGARGSAVYTVEIAERELDRDLKVEEETVDTLSVRGVHVFGFAPTEELGASGWGVERGDGVTRYFAPSPEVLLSDWFGRTHCFGGVNPDERAGQVGLRFTSIPDSLMVGMTGTFWLDSSSWRLLEIDFRFTGSPGLEQAKDQGGTIFLDVDDAGGWYVTRWHMRLPKLAARRSLWRSTGRVARPAQYVVEGYTERTGRVLGVEWGGGEALGSGEPPPHLRLRGTILERPPPQGTATHLIPCREPNAAVGRPGSDTWRSP